jgi:glycine cleavage system H protein
MAHIPAQLLYTSDHEWVSITDGVATVGITHHAQDQLGDIVFCGDSPSVGDGVGKGDVVAVVESVKANSDIYSPVAGEVTELNDELSNEPELINSDPYGRGWILKVAVGEDASEGLMTAEAYAALVESGA